jgi:DNA mismatch repair protein MutL
MPQINILDENTIDKIAAGEVVERPSSVVKELVENAIDAKATAITVEIKEGGISLIRITDNGCGIEKEQIPIAFYRHSTSKIRAVEDLITISSLGFRGEALSSIAAVAQVELITKTQEQFTGSRYMIEGGKEISLEEIGAPNGTTFLVKNLFYNTPVRRKFLKAPQTEAGYISDLMERMALSHPEISFKFINNGQIRLHTSGNGQLKDIIYHIYGRDIASNLLEIHEEFADFSVTGYIGKPIISRGNRNFESYFINGRYIKSSLIAKSIEDAYRGFMMQHKYPFTVLSVSIDGNLVDVNVHPNKMELRFSNGEEIYTRLQQVLQTALRQKELIPKVSVTDEKKEPAAKPKIEKKDIPEPFETNRLAKIREAVRKDSPYEPKYEKNARVCESQNGGLSARENAGIKETKSSSAYEVAEKTNFVAETVRFGTEIKKEASREEADGNAVVRKAADHVATEPTESERTNQTITAQRQKTESVETQSAETQRAENQTVETQKAKESSNSETPKGMSQELQNPIQTTLADFVQEDPKLLSAESKPYHRIIGQLFDTYWLVEFNDKFYMIDQHAAHEKVLFERTMASYQTKEFTSQMVSPPILLSLTMQEEVLLKRFLPEFEKLGFVIEHFGGKEYAVSAVPGNLYGLDGQTLLLELIDGLGGLSEKDTPDMVVEKIASMSCKAAVKGNQRLSREEMEHLIDELLTLENPYFCPHGRPVIVSMTKYEIEKKFKRIV